MKRASAILLSLALILSSCPNPFPAFAEEMPDGTARNEGGFALAPVDASATETTVDAGMQSSGAVQSDGNSGFVFILDEAAQAELAGETADAEGIDCLDEDLGIYRADTLAEVFDFANYSDLESIERDVDVVLQDAAAPNDPLYESDQKAYMTAIGQPEAWATGLDGSGVTIAVVDSGIIPSHDDLSAAGILSGINFVAGESESDTTDVLGHGTFITGLIHAGTDNGIGIAGLADGATILPLKCFKTTTTSMSSIISAISRAVDADVDVISMSFGVSSGTEALRTVIADAASKGIILIAAVGNTTTGDHSIMYPAAYPNVIGVGAFDTNGAVTNFSRQNATIDISAPGQSIVSLSYIGANMYRTGGAGTSYAVPFVSAMAALALQADPGMTPDEFLTLLRDTAVDAGATGYDTAYGWGRLDAGALTRALPTLHRLTFDLNGGSFPAGTVVPEAFTAESPDIPLPTPQKTDDDFTGWHLAADLSDSALAALPHGTDSDVVLHAGWQISEVADARINGAALLGSEGTLISETGEPDAASIFTVDLPAGTTLSAIHASDVVIRTVSDLAAVGAASTSDGGATWTADVVSANGAHSRRCEIRANVLSDPAPTLNSAYAAVSGSAVPASIDGRTAAVPFGIDISDWFDDIDEYGANDAAALTWRITGCTGRGTARIDGTTLSYVPVATDAGVGHDGGTVGIEIAASDAFSDCPDRAVVTLAVAAVPSSNARLAATSASFDLNETTAAYADASISISLYGNRLVSISADGTALAPDSDYLASTTWSSSDESGTLPFSCSVLISKTWMRSLSVGTHALSFAFDGGASADFTLTVGKTASAVVVPDSDTDTDDSSSSSSGGGGGGGASAGTVVLIQNGEVPLSLPVFRDGSLLIPAIDEASRTALFAQARLSGTFLLDFSGTSGIHSLRFSDDDFRAISEGVASNAAITRLSIKLSGASVEFDRPALAAFLSQMDGRDLTLSVSPVEPGALTARQAAAAGNRPVYSIQASSGGKFISEFSGMLSIEIPCALKAGETGAGLMVRHLADDGSLTDATEVEWMPLSGAVRFGTSHLSMWMIDYSALQAWTSPFRDVSRTSWFYDAVRYVNFNGLFNGTSKTAFAPDDGMTRAMFVTVLSRLDARTGTTTGAAVTAAPSFEDAAAGTWYSDAVNWAVSRGIASGVGGNRFGSVQGITREQIAVMLHAYANRSVAVPSGSGDGSVASVVAGFSDADSISVWAKDSVEWAVAEGLMKGDESGRLLPGSGATRAQVAVILQRFVEWLEAR